MDVSVCVYVCVYECMCVCVCVCVCVHLESFRHGNIREICHFFVFKPAGMVHNFSGIYCNGVWKKKGNKKQDYSNVIRCNFLGIRCNGSGKKEGNQKQR